MGIRILILLLLLLALGIAGCNNPEPIPLEDGGRPDPSGDAQVDKPSPFQDESAARVMLDWLPILATVGIALSVLMFFLDKPKIGIAGVASFITLMVVSLGLMLFAWWMAVIGGVAVLLATLAISIPLYRALKQTVWTAQATKAKLTDDGKAEVFGAGGLADRIQSKQTKALVQKLKPKTAEPALQ